MLDGVQSFNSIYVAAKNFKSQVGTEDKPPITILE